MNPAGLFKRRVILTLVVVMALLAISAVFPVYRLAAEETSPASPSSGSATAGLIAAALAFGFGAIGAGIAIGNVGSAAMGAIAEKPELASQAL
ncbi:MAG: ATPase, partial [Spirochaetales bacterium]|nr:ATPase [Spirochaetales bacterium]